MLFYSDLNCSYSQTSRSYRHKLGPALSTFSSLPAHYTSSKWTVLQAYMLAQSLLVRSNHGRPKDSDWLSTALDFLACMVAVNKDSDTSFLLSLSNGDTTNNRNSSATANPIEEIIDGLHHVVPDSDNSCKPSSSVRFEQFNMVCSVSLDLAVPLNHIIFQPHWPTLALSETANGSSLHVGVENFLNRVCPLVVLCILAHIYIFVFIVR